MTLDGTVTADIIQAQKNTNNTRGSSRGLGRGRNRGRGMQHNSRPVFQIFGKTGHLASVCYYRTYFNYMGSVPNQNKQSVSQSNPYATYIATLESVTDQAWCLDTGASLHVTNDINQLQHVNKYHGKTRLTIGNGNSLHIHHLGTTVINTNGNRPFLLKNVIILHRFQEILLVSLSLQLKITYVQNLIQTLLL